MIIFYFTVNETNIENLKRKTGIKCVHTIVDWLNFCRDICTQYFLLHPIILGGEGSVVEVDEAVLVKRKYNVGRAIRETWCFCMYDVNMKFGVVYVIENKNANVIYPLIQRHVLIGTSIHSDSARVYMNLPSIGYPVLSVNHSIGQFKNYETGATTNHVEAFWQRVKHWSKMRIGTHRTTLESHLHEFMWRQFKKDFLQFVQDIKEQYE